MTGSPRLVLTGGIAIVAQLILLAQTTPQQPPPVFRTGANLVRVDVTVTDRHGAPATSLTIDDFDVSEDGVQQTVETFKLVSADGRRSEGDDTSLEIRSPEHAAAEAARDDVRVFLVFWDEYHIGRFASAILGRKALTDFVTSAFGPTDLVALMNPLLPTDAIRWTRNRTDLAQAVQKLEGRYREYMPTRSILEEAQLMRRDVERLRSEVTISAVKSAASYMGGIKEGRKAIIFVSEGLPALERSDEMDLLQDLVRTANDNNTAIYTLDPRGLGQGAPDVLWMLADNTGASAFVNTNTPARALRQVVTDASAFYLLGYASTKNPADGKFHQIKVRVKRSGFDVRARRGYWAPSATDVDKAAREATDETPATVSTAIAALAATRPERALDVWAGTRRAADGSPRVTLAWTPRQREGKTPSPVGTLAIVVRNGSDSETFEAPLESGRYSFAARPGDLTLTITARDEQGDMIDEDKRELSVPDLSGSALVLSSPRVVVAHSASELKNLTGDPTPFTRHDFKRTDRAVIRFEMYGSSAEMARVSGRLLGRTGNELAKLAVTPPRAGATSYEIAVPLSSMARGEFLIAIEATEGDERVEALVPLRIIS